MSRGVLISSALHVAAFLAVLLGPVRPSLEWKPEEAIAVNLVAPPIELPPDRVPEKRPEPPRELTPPITDPVEEPEVAPPKEAPKETKPPPKEVKPRAPQRKPREFKKAVTPPSDRPSLADRLRERLQARPETPADPEPESPGPLPTAESKVHAVDFPFAWYLGTVKEKVLREWDTPGQTMLRGNRVVIAFEIHRNGRVENVRVERPSGTPGLDTSAVRAVDRAQPFPPLPDEREYLDLTMTFIVSGGG